MKQNTDESESSMKSMEEIYEIAIEMLIDSRRNGSRAARAMRDNWNRLSDLTKMGRSAKVATEISTRIQFQKSFSCASSHENSMWIAAVVEASLEW